MGGVRMHAMLQSKAMLNWHAGVASTAQLGTSTRPHRNATHCTLLHHTTQRSAAMHHTTPRHTAPRHTAPRHTKPDPPTKEPSHQGHPPPKATLPPRPPSHRFLPEWFMPLWTRSLSPALSAHIFHLFSLEGEALLLRASLAVCNCISSQLLSSVDMSAVRSVLSTAPASISVTEFCAALDHCTIPEVALRPFIRPR